MFTVLKTGLGALLLILLKSVTLYMPDTYRGQKRALDSLKLELNVIVRWGSNPSPMEKQPVL